jgi:SagB-type dehydrogenase family enzyme
MSTLAAPSPAPPAPFVLGMDQTVALSPHVCIRPVDGVLCLESTATGRSFPLAGASVLRLLAALARPVRVADLLAAVDEEQCPAVLRFLERCREMRVLAVVDPAGAPVGPDDEGLAHWEFHDLLFHSRSRRGRTRFPVGATWHLHGVLPPEPPLREASAEGAIPLFHPDLDTLKAADPPLTRVLEARRSRYSVRPLPVRALGELLYRALRITSVEGEHTGAGDERTLRKVYPSGGALHSLDAYVVAWACDGLAPGMYRYDAAAHALVPVRAMDAEVEQLLREAQAGTGRQLPGYPPVLIVLASRFRRVMIKYQGLAYAAILKEVGGVYQTLYLVATAMGLSPCAVGAGDADRFARVAGTRYHDETSVGEFIVAGGDEAPVP